MVLEARLSFHKGHIEQDPDFLKLRKTNYLKEQVATETEDLVRSTCQSSHFAVPLGAIREKVHQTCTRTKLIKDTYIGFKEEREAKQSAYGKL